MNTKGPISSPWLTLAWLFASASLYANGFVVTRDEQGSVTAAAQKALILYDQGREDMVLQARYEGPAQEFGWLIPVPGAPEFRAGSMACFYDLSRLTQEPLWPEEFDVSSLSSSDFGANRIKPVTIKATGAIQVSVLSAQDTNSLSEWLAIHDFVLPKAMRPLLDRYVTNHWYFVAARIKPDHGTASAELQPLVISFPSDKCVFPLALSAAGSRPSEVTVLVLAAEPLMSRALFEKSFKAYRREQKEWIEQRPDREKQWYDRTNHIEDSEARMERFRRPSWSADPADPMPSAAVMLRLRAATGSPGVFSESDDDFWSRERLVKGLEARSKDLPACAKELPRMAGKSWWLTKQVETLAPEEISDLDFEPAIPIFAEKLGTPVGRSLFRWLPQFGAQAVPVVLAGVRSSDLAERRLAASAMAQMADPRLAPAVAGLLADADPRIRTSACAAAQRNWEGALAPRLVQLLSDPEAGVCWAALLCLQDHPAESSNYVAAYRRMVEEGGPATLPAMQLLRLHHVDLPRVPLASLLSSSDPCTIRLALGTLGDRKLELDEITPLLTNSLPMARLQGLLALLRLGNQAALDRILPMLRDPEEGLRWTVRTNLRRLSGKKLGADPAAWEKWWAENRRTFVPVSTVPAALKER